MTSRAAPRARRLISAFINRPVAEQSGASATHDVMFARPSPSGPCVTGNGSRLQRARYMATGRSQGSCGDLLVGGLRGSALARCWPSPQCSSATRFHTGARRGAPSRSAPVWCPVLRCRSMAGFEVSTEGCTALSIEPGVSAVPQLPQLIATPRPGPCVRYPSQIAAFLLQGAAEAVCVQQVHSSLPPAFA